MTTIGYYVHHQGSGHLHRAGALAAVSPWPVTVLSSLRRPDSWQYGWVDLRRDDDGISGLADHAAAGGALHWAPLRHEGLSSRMGAVADWVRQVRPAVVVSDVSVEVALFVRLLGVPVVSVVLPGERGDPPHRLGHQVSEELVAFWPEAATGMVAGLTEHDQTRLRCLGGLSRFPTEQSEIRRQHRPDGARRVVVLSGRGGDGPTADQIARATADAPHWHWDVLGGPGSWNPDPIGVLREASAVVTHAGQNAIAEVAALRVPAVVVPENRPHQEQIHMAATLTAQRWPALVEPEFPVSGWTERLDLVHSLDTDRWQDWCDGDAAARFIRVLRPYLDRSKASRA